MRGLLDQPNDTTMSEFLITNVSRQELQNLINEAVTKTMHQYFRELKSPISEYFDALGTAAFLGVSLKTLQNYCYTKQIPHIKRGGKLYFRKSDLEQWLSQGYKKTNDDIVNSVNSNLSKRRLRSIARS